MKLAIAIVKASSAYFYTEYSAILSRFWSEYSAVLSPVSTSLNRWSPWGISFWWNGQVRMVIQELVVLYLKWLQVIQIFRRFLACTNIYSNRARFKSTINHMRYFEGCMGLMVLAVCIYETSKIFVEILRI